MPSAQWRLRSDALEAAQDVEPAEASTCANTYEVCGEVNLSKVSEGAIGLVCVGEARCWQEGMLTGRSVITSSLFRVADVHICVLRFIAGLPGVVFHRTH